MTNPYLNTPPTAIKRMIPKAEGDKKKLLQQALQAWRITQPNPAHRLTMIKSRKTARELIYVDENYVAHDDEGNSWQVPRSWWGRVPGSYPSRDVPDGPPVRQKHPKKEEAYSVWADVAKYMGLNSDAKFIRSVGETVYHKGYPSLKQEKILQRIRKKFRDRGIYGTYKDFLRVRDKLREERGPLSTYDHKKWLREQKGEQKGEDESPEKSPSRSRKPDPTKVQPQMDARALMAERLDILDALYEAAEKKGNDWLMKFVESIKGQVMKRRPLSEKQLKAVRHNLYKNRMRQEANMFREASLASKVARLHLAKKAGMDRESVIRGIEATLNRVTKRLGFQHDKAEVEEWRGKTSVTGAYRSGSLPKGGAYDVGEYEYEDMVAHELSRADVAFQKALSPYMKHIDDIDIYDEEKSWIHVIVRLK